MLLSIGEYYIWENMFCERELKLIYSKHNVFSIDDLWSLCQELYHQVTNRFVLRQCTLLQNIVHHPKFKCSDVLCFFAILGYPLVAIMPLQLDLFPVINANGYYVCYTYYCQTPLVKPVCILCIELCILSTTGNLVVVTV